MAEKNTELMSVSEAIELAQGTLKLIPSITVLGEVSGFRGPSRSGHCYFTIKDDNASVEVIIWSRVYQARAFDLRDGLKVQFTGKFGIYAATGRLSFQVSSFSLVGEGLLRQQVAERANKLRREGLMDESRKRHIPVFCTRVAVVTSLNGKVIGDVKRTLARRNPLVEVICVNAAVQGEGAEAQLIHGLDLAASINPDCILLVRGGGSFEELMTFNDEALARAVAACPVPVITGIGHEPDTSICDMVSDRRASTPTAAAESVAPSFEQLTQKLQERQERLSKHAIRLVDTMRAEQEDYALDLTQSIRKQLEYLSVRLDDWASRRALNDPTMVLDRRTIELGMAQDRLLDAMQHNLDVAKKDLQATSGRMLLQSKRSFVVDRKLLEAQHEHMRRLSGRLVKAFESNFAAYAGKLDALSPLAVLSRGYSIAYDDEGVATSAGAFTPGETVRVRFSDGDVFGVVDHVDAAPSSK